MRRRTWLLGILLLLTTVARAATIHVPADQPTIQAGIDAAANGDSVLVADGVYMGEGNRNIAFRGMAITVASVNGAANTIIDCEQRGRGFTFTEGEPDSAILDGFTIKNGQAQKGGAIYCEQASPTIRHCVIVNSQATGGSPFDGGGGIYCVHSEARIEECEISSNTAGFAGGGIFCYERPSPTITDCTIADNQAPEGGGVYSNWSSPTITDCIIRENHATRIGGGFACEEHSLPKIHQCTIVQNVAEQGGGVFSSVTSDPSIVQCVIAENRTRSDGGGIWCGVSFGGMRIERCTITQNEASGHGGGVYAFIETGGFRMTRSIIWENRAGGQGSEIRLIGGVSVTSCDIQDGLQQFGAVDQNRIYNQNIDADPQFVDSEDGDYRLLPDSPCIGPPLLGALEAVATSPVMRRPITWAELKQH